MSDTPRTDAQLANTGKFHACWPNVDADFAKTLERELNQAIKERDEARRAFDDIDMCKLGQAPCAWAIQLIKERDENKAGWDRASLVALRLERERNEARECLRYAVELHADYDAACVSDRTLNRWRKAAGLEPA